MTFDKFTIKAQEAVQFVAPNNHYPVDSETIGVHRVAGSWRKRKLGRFLEIKVKHLWHVVKYALFKK